MEYEKLEVIVTDVESQAQRVAAMIVFDTDAKEQIFWRWWLEDVAQQLDRRRGCMASYKAGVYEVIRKRGKQVTHRIHLRHHTATTPDDRRGQSRVVRGKLSIKVL